jgi:peptide subunit release factor 1 (eRF1)
MPLVDEVTQELIRTLAETRAPQESVLSVYLDLDPARFATPPARQSEIDSLIDAAHREIEDRKRSHEELMALRAGLQRARELLSDPELSQGARSAAVFVCEPLELEQAVRMSRPLTSQAIVSDEPFIAPLLEGVEPGRVCVALVDERSARILRGSAAALREAVSFGDDVPGRQKQGGWSQARYQRSMAEDVEHHLSHVARTLFDLLKVAPYERLLIGCTETLWPRVLEKLHPYVRERLIEHRLSLDTSADGPAEVTQAADEILGEEQRAHEEELLAELRARLATADGHLAAAGLDAVLQALVERRVEALLYDEGLSATGVMCPRGDWIGSSGESCPLDGEPLEQREDIVEEAVRAAVAQSAEVLTLRDRPDLGPVGRIAATLRF